MLKSEPLLINKIIAERLSDKIQVMMVPSDGKFFFANDVMKGFSSNPAVQQEMDGDDKASCARGSELNRKFVEGLLLTGQPLVVARFAEGGKSHDSGGI